MCVVFDDGPWTGYPSTCGHLRCWATLIPFMKSTPRHFGLVEGEGPQSHGGDEQADREGQGQAKSDGGKMDEFREKRANGELASPMRLPD